MTTATRANDVVMLVLSVVLGVGSVVMFGMMRSLHGVDMHWPASVALPWDALLSLAFFVQHSGMVRRSFRARLAGVVPPHHQGALYSIASGLVLALLVIFWQRSEIRLVVLEGFPRWIVQSLSSLAVAAFVLAACSLRRSFDPLGVRPIRAHLRGQVDRADDLVVRGPYLWVRHPLYSCVLVLLWTNPEITADGLLLSVMWSLWICLATLLEERDLVAQFAESYRSYQRQVPMLVPWRGRVTLVQQRRLPLTQPDQPCLVRP